MAAGLGALCHNGVSAAPFHELCKGHGSHHRDHHDPGVLPHLHVLSRIPGPGSHHLDAFLHDHLCHLIGVGAHEHDVDADGLFRQLPGLSDLLADHLARRVGAADESQASGLRNGRCQMMLRHPGHSALDDRIFNSQQFCDSSFHSVSNPFRPLCGLFYALIL